MTRHNTTTYSRNQLSSTSRDERQNNNRHGYQHNYYHDDGVNDDDNNTEQTTTTDTMTRTSRNSSGTRVSLEDNYSRAMNRMKRGGDFDPNYDRQSFREEEKEKRTTTSRSSNGKNNGRSSSNAPLSSRLSGSSGNRDNRNRTTTSRRGSEESAAGSKKSNICKTSRLSSNSNSNANNNTAAAIIKKMAEKRTISNKDPSEETIAIFGAYGVTGNHFLKFAMEAGYKVQALILPGMEMNDVACNDNLQLVTGSFDEDEKIRKVVENATYVVCLLNDCDRSLHHQDQENLPPPIGNTDESDVYNSFSLNLNFMHNLVPILEQSDTCRVLLYQVSYMNQTSYNHNTIQCNTIVTAYLN
jgi:hypothetical protein